MTHYRGRRESGHYPPGAEFDPNAPWNQEDERCEDCEKYLDECECETKGEFLSDSDKI